MKKNAVLLIVAGLASGAALGYGNNGGDIAQGNYPEPNSANDISFTAGTGPKTWTLSSDYTLTARYVYANLFGAAGSILFDFSNGRKLTLQATDELRKKFLMYGAAGEVEFFGGTWDFNTYELHFGNYNAAETPDVGYKGLINSTHLTNISTMYLAERNQGAVLTAENAKIDITGNLIGTVINQANQTYVTGNQAIFSEGTKVTVGGQFLSDNDNDKFLNGEGAADFNNTVTFTGVGTQIDVAKVFAWGRTLGGMNLVLDHGAVLNANSTADYAYLGGHVKSGLGGNASITVDNGAKLNIFNHFNIGNVNNVAGSTLKIANGGVVTLAGNAANNNTLYLGYNGTANDNAIVIDNGTLDVHALQIGANNAYAKNNSVTLSGQDARLLVRSGSPTFRGKEGRLVVRDGATYSVTKSDGVFTDLAIGGGVKNDTEVSGNVLEVLDGGVVDIGYRDAEVKGSALMIGRYESCNNVARIENATLIAKQVYIGETANSASNEFVIAGEDADIRCLWVPRFGGRYSKLTVTDGAYYTTASEMAIGNIAGADGSSEVITAGATHDNGRNAVIIGGNSSNVATSGCLLDIDGGTMKAGSVFVGWNGSADNTLRIAGEGKLETSNKQTGAIGLFGDYSKLIFDGCNVNEPDWYLRSFYEASGSRPTRNCGGEIRFTNNARVSVGILQMSCRAVPTVANRVTVDSGAKVTILQGFQGSGTNNVVTIDNGELVASTVTIGSTDVSENSSVVIRGENAKLQAADAELGLIKQTVTFDLSDGEFAEAPLQGVTSASIDPSCSVVFAGLEEILADGVEEERDIPLMTAEKCYFLGATYAEDERLFAYNETLPDGCEVRIAADRGSVVLHLSPKTVAIGETQYATIQSALRNVNYGDTIRLLTNIQLSSPIVIDGKQGITIDLAGYEISSIEDFSGYNLKVLNNGELTIVDSSEEKTGCWVKSSSTSIFRIGEREAGHQGKLVLASGEIRFSGHNEQFEQTVDEETVMVQQTGSIVEVISGEFEMRGGMLNNESADEFEAAIRVASAGVANVYGGDIIGELLLKESDEDPGDGVIVISLPIDEEAEPARFDRDQSDFCASDCRTDYDDDCGMYVVVKASIEVLPGESVHFDSYPTDTQLANIVIPLDEIQRENLDEDMIIEYCSLFTLKITGDDESGYDVWVVFDDEVQAEIDADINAGTEQILAAVLADEFYGTATISNAKVGLYYSVASGDGLGEMVEGERLLAIEPGYMELDVPEFGGEEGAFFQIRVNANSGIEE